MKENIQTIILCIILVLLVVYISITTSYVIKIEVSTLISVLSLIATIFGWFIVYRLTLINTRNHISLDKKIDIFNKICELKNDFYNEYSLGIERIEIVTIDPKESNRILRNSFKKFEKFERYVRDWSFLMPTSITNLDSLKEIFEEIISLSSECVDFYEEIIDDNQKQAKEEMVRFGDMIREIQDENTPIFKEKMQKLMKHINEDLNTKNINI